MKSRAPQTRTAEAPKTARSGIEPTSLIAVHGSGRSEVKSRMAPRSTKTQQTGRIERDGAAGQVQQVRASGREVEATRAKQRWRAEGVQRVAKVAESTRAARVSKLTSRA